ncbi:hypothetical protein HYALB_00012158 [Hymenoscyphus albidus]|uniref:Actin-like ATPase domain-containing protein n=1 Tax=Hymenoscyphus albidus TaxID=595503 RepID=A0A9N9LNW2_9HELO|nr:hypothetical protein HYALB_00012158 [Hymenoscyphus albidus]
MSSSTGPGPAHRNVASIRSPLANIPASPTSPHTPTRGIGISSAFGSPSALRAEDDHVVIELGARYFRAGFAGEALPISTIGFGPEAQRRTGDYRKWEAGHDAEWRKRIRGKSWGEAHEFWSPDLRDLDMGLVSDKLDRAMRDAFAKNLLIDSRPRKVSLILPSAFPLPLLSTVLDTMFANFQSPTISLMSSPVLCTISAGLRSALLVDIGWAETVVSAIYELREVQSTRSVRATKWLGKEMSRVLSKLIEPNAPQRVSETSEMVEDEAMSSLLSFEECEQVVTRMAWCKPGKTTKHISPAIGLTPVKEEDELRSSMRSLHIGSVVEKEAQAFIDLTSTSPPRKLQVPFATLSEPCESTFFATGISESELDDEETPLHLLIYRSLLKLPIDVRSTCMARIVFVGGGSKLPGLQSRVLEELDHLIEHRGWVNIQGKAVEQLRNNPRFSKTRNKQSGRGPMEVPPGDVTPASLQEQESDPIEDTINRAARKINPSLEEGHLRAIHSLGAWAGGSLLTNLKVPSVSVIEREQWLQHGVLGTSKSGEVSVSVSSRQSMGAGGAFKSVGGERSSWTLGLWA